MRRKPPKWLVYLVEFLILWIIGLLEIRFFPGDKHDAFILAVTGGISYVIFGWITKRFFGDLTRDS